MILPLHDRVRDRVRAVLAELYGQDTAAVATIPIEYPPNRTLGRSGLAGRVRAGAPAAQSAARHRAGDRRRGSTASTASPRVEAAPNGYLNVFLDRPAFLLQRLGVIERHAERRAPTGKTIVEHTAINPEQGGAHRPPAQLRARRHAGARARVPRHAGRSPELHRRHRRAGRGRRRRLSRARGPRPGGRAGDRRLDAVRLLLLGPLRARSRSGTAATRSA